MSLSDYLPRASRGTRHHGLRSLTVPSRTFFRFPSANHIHRRKWPASFDAPSAVRSADWHDVSWFPDPIYQKLPFSASKLTHKLNTKERLREDYRRGHRIAIQVQISSASERLHKRLWSDLRADAGATKASRNRNLGFRSECAKSCLPSSILDFLEPRPLLSATDLGWCSPYRSDHA